MAFPNNEINNITRNLSFHNLNNPSSLLKSNSSDINPMFEKKKKDKIKAKFTSLKLRENLPSGMSFIKKRKRYIKNNKFVYVHPGSAAAKKLEIKMVFL
jgi:hypothetical protein